MGESYPCPHGMGKASSCVTCMTDGPVAPPDQRLKAQFWLNAAHYDGVCGRCGGPIVAGEPIGKTENDGWCCERCVEP